MEKFVLDTCVVKDLLQYNKDKIQKINNGVDIKKVYDYITKMKFDGISKCYLTIYTFYEVLKDFKEDFSKETYDFFELLYPQTITSLDARKVIDDYNLINLYLKSKDEQENVLSQLKNLIADKISGFMTEIFITMLTIFIKLLEMPIDFNHVRIKRVAQTLQEISATTFNILHEGIRKSIQNGKRSVVKYLDNEYKKMMKLVAHILKKIDNEKTMTYKK